MSLTYSPEFESAFETLLTFEGGLSEDPHDPGGVTKYGISARSYPRLDIPNLTKEKAKEIYWLDWWQRYQYGLLGDPDLASKVFILAVNMGNAPAITLLQRAVNQIGPEQVSLDGRLGIQTHEAIRKCSAEHLLSVYRLLAVRYYLDLKRPRYLAGWIMRAIS